MVVDFDWDLIPPMLLLLMVDLAVAAGLTASIVKTIRQQRAREMWLKERYARLRAESR